MVVVLGRRRRLKHQLGRFIAFEARSNWIAWLKLTSTAFSRTGNGKPPLGAASDSNRSWFYRACLVRPLVTVHDHSDDSA